MPPRRSRKSNRPSKITPTEDKDDDQHAPVEQEDEEQEQEQVDQPQAAGRKEPEDTPQLPSMPDLPPREQFVTVEVHREEDEEARSETPTVEEAQSNVSSSSEDDEPRKKRNRQPNLHLGDRVEEELLEWYKENECFYNKKLGTYKEGGYKRKLMEDKAKDLGITYLQIKGFFKGMRDRFVKIRKIRSGQGSLDLTDREQGIFQLCQFLERHITKSKTRKTAKFPGKTPTATTTTTTTSTTAATSVPTKAKPSAASGGPSQPVVGTSDDEVLVVKEDPVVIPGKGKAGAQTSQPAHSAQEIQALAYRLVDRADAVVAARDTPKSPHEEEVHKFLGYLSTQLRKIPEDNWWDFTMEVMSVVRRHQAPRQPPPVHTFQRTTPPGQDFYQQQQQQQHYGYGIGQQHHSTSMPARGGTGLTPSPSQQQQHSQPSYTQIAQCNPTQYYADSPGYPNLNTPQLNLSPPAVQGTPVRPRVSQSSATASLSKDNSDSSSLSDDESNMETDP